MKLYHRALSCTACVLLMLGWLVGLWIAPAWAQTPSAQEVQAVYIVAIDAEFAPYEFADAGGRSTSFTVNLLIEIGKLAGVTFQFQPMSWPQAVAGLENGDVDLINMIKTPERAQKYALSDAHSNISQAIFRHKSATGITSLESLTGHTVALQQNDISTEQLAGRTDFEKIIVHSKEEGFLLLNAGQVDAFLAAEQPGIWLIQKYNLKQVEIAELGLFPKEFGLAARKDNAELIAMLNGYLSTLKLSGQYDALADKWLAGTVSNDSWVVRHQTKILWGLTLLAIAAMVSIGWNVSLQRIVARRTRELLASRTQAELQANRLLTLVTHFPDGIALESSQRKIKQINRQLCEMLGIADSPEAMVGADCQQIAEKARHLFVNGDNFSGRVQEIVAAQRLLLDEELHLTDGRTFMRDYVPVKGPDDTIEHLWHYRDITQRKQAENTLKKLSVATEQSPVSIVITNVDGEIEYVNPKFTRVTGYTAEEAWGKNPRILQGKKLPQAEYERLWQTILSGREWRGLFHNKKKNGDLYWEKALIAPIMDDQNHITHFVAVKEDITQRKQAEEALRTSHQRLEQTLAELTEAQNKLVQQERAAAVGQVAAGIAHDFNNILTGILGYTELMQMSPDTPAAMKGKLEQIYNSGNRAAKLVSQLLDFSRQSVYQPKRLNLAELTRQTMATHKPALPEGITIKLDFATDDIPIEADPAQLQQVITNLTTNAAQAMPAGGTLTIGLSMGEVSETQCAYCKTLFKGRWVILTVTDTGTGISPDVLPKIFEPFFTTKDVGQGSGLGLSQVVGIVDLNQGHITVVNSIEGQGTTVSVFLPPMLVLPPPKAAASTAHPPTSGQGETILLVENEPTVQEMETSLLKYLGYRVVSASTGRDALTLYETHGSGIALVLAETIMPDMAGNELLDALKQQNPHVKAAFISDRSSFDAANQTLLERGAVACFQKPLSFEKISRTIDQTLHPATEADTDAQTN